MSALLRILSGLLLWAVAFAAIYGLQGLGCALEWQRHRVGPVDALRAALVLAWLAFLAGSLLLAWRGASLERRREVAGERALVRLEYGIALAGAAAIAWTLFPVAWVSACH